MIKFGKHFRVVHTPDLTETGNYQDKTLIMVYSHWGYHQEIVFEWALRKFGRYLGKGVQGWGFMPKFNIYPITRDVYDKEIGGEKLFLSPKEIEGFPENIDYTKEWDLSDIYNTGCIYKGYNKL